MKKDYNFFHNLLISWWQGTNTKNELIQQVDAILKLNNISQEYEFISQFEEAIRNYDENYYFEWLEHKEYAKDTAPTLIGLVHSIEEYKSGNLTRNFPKYT